jgi:hypothetical protein
MPFEQPVVAADGHTYDYKSITQFFRNTPPPVMGPMRINIGNKFLVHNWHLIASLGNLRHFDIAPEFSNPDNGPEVMKLSFVLVERHGDVDCHLADQWNRGPCSDPEWQQMQEAALSRMSASMSINDVDIDEISSMYWEIMHEVFGPTVDEEEEEDNDESMGPWAETILEGIVDRNENNNNPDNNNNDDLEEDPT